MRLIVLLIGILFLSGCGGVKAGFASHEKYLREVRCHLNELNGQINKSSSLLYRWTPPMVQEVVIPAHVSQGVLIPEHKEMVVIKQGEWLTHQSTLEQRKNNEEIKTHHVNGASADLSLLPQGWGRP